MATLGSGVQLILFTEGGSGGYRCEGFSGFPAFRPALVAIESCGSQRARSNARTLAQLLRGAIGSSGLAVRPAQVPCRGSIACPSCCHGHDISEAQKLLVLVGDETNPFPSSGAIQYWTTKRAGRDRSYRILPILPAATRVRAVLAPPIDRLNAASWENSIEEVLPSVLSNAGITPKDNRIFISYRRMDSEAIAEQLFDLLTRENFDVFLDRFSIDPGVDFQTRLAQELGDKSMVLLIESRNILKSSRTVFEINFAKQYKLGQLALNLPYGKKVDDIDEIGSRIKLPRAAFEDASKCDRIKKETLNEIVQRVKSEHGRALLRRRAAIRQAMRDALTSVGVYRHALAPDGPIHAEGGRGRQYLLWLTTRPPGLPDFHATAAGLFPPCKGLIIGPTAANEASRTAMFDWLASISTIDYFDEGDILSVAKRIRSGT